MGVLWVVKEELWPFTKLNWIKHTALLEGLFGCQVWGFVVYVDDHYVFVC